MSRSDWFLTFTGERVYVRDPDPAYIHIGDIAHALAHLCRFGGHTRVFYSVAQHSVLVSELVPPEQALAGLMHDAPEAYLGDVIRPVKRELAGPYGELEEHWWRAIAARFGLPGELSDEVHQADVRALATERRDLIQHLGHRWLREEDMVPDPRPIDPWPPIIAKLFFLRRFEELGGERHDTLPAAAEDEAPDTLPTGGVP